MKIRNRTFEGDVPKLTKWLYTTSGAFRDASYQFVALFLMTFVQFCGLGGVSGDEYTAMYSVITIIVIILRLWDGFNDPIMGFLIEKIRFKSGKYRPWIWSGAVLNSIVVTLMFWINPTGWAYVAFFGVFYFLWDFTYTINDIAFWSVLPSLSSNEKVRANLTTLLSIFVSIGAFAVGGIVPMLASGNSVEVYRWTALITSILFCVSQVILAIFMKEKKEDETVAKNDEKIKFRDIFTVLKKNDQLRASIIAILLYYTGASILTAAGLNYFYFNFGYEKGGNYQFYFTIVYAAATLIAQFIYPLLVNKAKISKKKLFTICGIVTICAYVFLFLYVFIPQGSIETFFPVLCVFGFIAFFGQTIMSLILYVYIQDTIDYNEYKFNERRESSIFSLRAFTAKLASSVQQLILYGFLYASSLFAVSNTIANAEKNFAGDEAKIIETAQGAISTIEQWQRIVFQVGFAIVPLVLFVACLLVVTFKYKIDENSHQMMVAELEKRKLASGESTNIQG